MNETKETLEPDWEFYEWANKIEKEMKKEIRLSESEWLNVFPEAKSTIKEKIKEWKVKADNARLDINKAFEVTKKSAEENRWFFEAVVKYTFFPVQEFIEAKRHIKRLTLATTKKKQKMNMIVFKEQIEKAKNSDIARIAQAYGLQIKKAGRNYRLLCPKHEEKTPSFYLFSPTHFVCFGCGIKGDVISFVQMMENISFREAVIRLQNP